MLRSLPLVAVRQEHDEARNLAPLRLPADDELVDHRLPNVREVAVLGLPEHQRVTGVDGVSVLEAHNGDLREWAVVDSERRVCLRHRVKRHVTLVGRHVVERGVALRERPTLGILAREPDRHPVLQQRTEGQRLGVGPVHVLDAPPVLLQEPFQLVVGREAFGTLQQGFVYLLKPVLRDCRVRDLGQRRAQEILGFLSIFLDLGGVLVDLLHPGLDLLYQRFSLALFDKAATLQLSRPELAHPGMLPDRLVHLRLGVGRLVALVVPVAPVTDQVDHEVLLELLAVGVGHVDGGEAGFGIIGVDVDDRDLEPLRQVAGVLRGAGILLLGREA